MEHAVLRDEPDVRDIPPALDLRLVPPVLLLALLALDDDLGLRITGLGSELRPRSGRDACGKVGAPEDARGSSGTFPVS